MRIGYLMNIYPVTSATFIRREMRAIEDHGHTVKRFAIRRWEEELVDPADKADQEKTHYLLSGRISGLVKDFFLEAVSNPKGMVSALGAWRTLHKNARSGFVRHTAYLLEAISLKRALIKADIQHLHAHFSTNTAAVALMSKRLGGPNFSFTAHGPDEFIDWGPASLAFKVQEAEFVVAITNYCRTQLALAAGYETWDKLKVVRCGIELDDFPFNDQLIDETAPFVCVGRLCPQKAQPLIIEAIAKIKSSTPNIRVEFIGDGESRADVENAIRKHVLEENVTLLGWRSNAEVRDILGRGRALLLPSFAEGLPIVIMEAMALGRPVISTFIAGIPELVDSNTGWIIPPGSIDEIANAMKAAYAASPQQLAEMGAEGRKRVEDLHNVRQSAKELTDLMEAGLKR